VAANLFNIAFTKGFPVTDEVALDAASTFERRAYTAAAVASNVTTGSRPEAETTLGYARQALCLRCCSSQNMYFSACKDLSSHMQARSYRVYEQ
jgi:hypothetical protein